MYMEPQYRVEKVAENVWKIMIRDAFQDVNAYLLMGSEVSMIDFGHPVAKGSLLDALKEIGMKLEDIDQVFYTHPHIDHMGGGIRTYLDLGMPGKHYGYKRIRETTDSFDEVYRQFPYTYSQICPRFADKLLDSETLRWAQHYLPILPNQLELIPVSDGERIAIGDMTLQAIHTPGHNPSHLCYYLEPHRFLFTGDLFAGDLTPLESNAGGDMEDLLRSFAKVSGLDVNTVLPGHGRNTTLDEALQRAHRTVAREEKTILAYVKEHPGATLEDILEAVTGKAPDNGMFLIPVLGRVKTHLEMLEKQKVIKSTVTAAGKHGYHPGD